jgi:hypothetical protein
MDAPEGQSPPAVAAVRRAPIYAVEKKDERNLANRPAAW